MSDFLNRLQDQRRLNGLHVHTSKYGNICDLLAKTFGQGWDSKLFREILDAVYDYGISRKEYGFWDGAIDAHIGMITTTLERVEREQYAKDAADAGQQDLLDGPDPDDDRTHYGAEQ